MAETDAKPAAADGPGGPDAARRLLATLALGDGAGFLVRVLGARATAEYERLTGQSAVTPRQFGVLLTLHQRGPLTLTELAEAILVDRSTVGEMTRRMAARGLIDRRENGADARSTKVSIAPAGDTVLAALIEGAAALQAALLAPVPPPERRGFLRNLKRIALADPDA